MSAWRVIAARDAGFVLVDALVAVGLVAAAGTLVYAIGNDVLQSQERALDRSMALATMAMLAKEYSVAGATRETEDSAFSYRMRPGRSDELPMPPVRFVTIDATSADGTIAAPPIVVGE
jgi:hypothetical protein